MHYFQMKHLSCRGYAMVRKIHALVVVVVSLSGLNMTCASDRDYAYVITVGKNPDVYDYTMINDAIVAMNAMDPPLGSDTLGCIEVYPGTYVEQLNIATGGNDLPAHCDLIGMGSNIDDVQIWHGGGGIYNAGVNCTDDNLVSHLRIYNHLFGSNSQNAVCFNGDGTLDNCIVHTHHGPAVVAFAHLVVSGSGTDIKAYFRSCIKAYSTFEIYDCTLRPSTFTPVGQDPGGITVMTQPGYDIVGGIIDNVTITANGYAKEKFTNLRGINLSCYFNPDALVYISNTQINLTLTVEAGSAQEEFLVQGITANKGVAVLENCTINISGIEDIGNPSDPDDDGYAVKVEGIQVGNGAIVEILGGSSIFTSRTVARYNEYGHEYLLINGYECCPYLDDGTLGVDFDTVAFNPNGENPPDGYDASYVYGDITDLDCFYLKSGAGQFMSWFDNLGNLFLKGNLTENTTPTATGNDEFRVQDSAGDDVAIIDITNGNMYLAGSVQATWANPSEGSDDFIIYDDGNPAVPVAYIDGSGDLYLKGQLYGQEN
jgi:hypothetical protein